MGVNANELIARIEQLNKQVVQLNGERQRQLGLLDATKKQLRLWLKTIRLYMGYSLQLKILA